MDRLSDSLTGIFSRLIGNTYWGPMSHIHGVPIPLVYTILDNNVSVCYLEHFIRPVSFI
jgi:hypothetical protein